MSKEEELYSSKLAGVLPRESVVSKLAIVGAPNAGKSTLLNCLLRSERALVSDIPGTTVDPIEAHFDLYFTDDEIEQIEGKEQNEIVETEENEEEIDVKPVNRWRSVRIVDTAGIRKNKLVKGAIEAQSIYRSLRSITESDIVLYMIDAQKGITHQDRRLIDIVLEKGKALIICLNKKDLLLDIFSDPKKKKEWMLDLRALIPWLDYCDMLTLSALKGEAINGLKKCIKKTILVQHRRYSTAKLNRTVTGLMEKNPIILNGSRGKPFRLKYATQVKSIPPTFILFTNKVKEIPQNYRRYLQNGLRKELKMHNTPVHLIFRSGKVKDALNAKEVDSYEREEHTILN